MQHTQKIASNVIVNMNNKKMGKQQRKGWVSYEYPLKCNFKTKLVNGREIKWTIYTEFIRELQSK